VEKKNIERLKEWIEELTEEKIPILVEGRKDKSSLEKLGVSNVHVLGGRPLFEIAENFGHEKEIVLLFDSDRRGRCLTDEFRIHFQRLGVRTVTKYMSRLRRIGISHVEGVFNCYKRHKLLS